MRESFHLTSTDGCLVMRQLSPREIRLTSPRALTPRMAARVAGANLELPSIPRFDQSKLPQSPLASAPPVPDTATPRSDWPSVSFSKLGAPLTSELVAAEPEPRNMSAETIQRMGTDSRAEAVFTEWKPRRPVRPPSPKIEQARTLPHSLSPELVDHLRSPTPGSPITPSEDKGGKARLGGRTDSITRKGLRHQISAKSIGYPWRKEGKERPGMPHRAATVTVGLFNGAVGPANTAITNIRTDKSASSTGNSNAGDFRTILPIVPTTPPSTSISSRSSSDGFASRILQGSFSFSRKQTLAGRPKRSSSISSPMSDSSHRIDSAARGQTPDPPSPVSPRSVKRKPVPEVSGALRAVGGEKLRGFVLEDPPKKRVPLGKTI